MESTSTRKRFHKPYRFFYKVEKHPLRSLDELFQTFHLDDFREEIPYWQQLAMANDQSVYDEGAAREDLMDFCHQLLRLAEALHILNEKVRQQKNNKWKDLSKKAQRITSNMHHPVLLSEEDANDPKSLIRQFCNIFSYTYTKIEIFDLLHAVITYEGEKEVYKGNLMLFYQCLLCLVNLAYVICRNPKLPNQKNNMLYNQYVNKPSADELWYLSKDAVENPQKAIYDFFDTYGLGSSHERLWHMLKLTLSSPEINDWNEVKRTSCVHFYELLTHLIKANYTLFLKMRKEAV